MHLRWILAVVAIGLSLTGCCTERVEAASFEQLKALWKPGKAKIFNKDVEVGWVERTVTTKWKAMMRTVGGPPTWMVYFDVVSSTYYFDGKPLSTEERLWIHRDELIPGPIPGSGGHGFHIKYDIPSTPVPQRLLGAHYDPSFTDQHYSCAYDWEIHHYGDLCALSEVGTGLGVVSEAPQLLGVQQQSLVGKLLVVDQNNDTAASTPNGAVPILWGIIEMP